MSISVNVVCPCCHAEMFGRDITYNLVPMLAAAGMNTRDMHGKTAGACLGYVQSTLGKLKEEPDRFRAMNPPNGWGTYDGLVEVLEELAKAIERRPAFVMWVR